MAQSTENTDAFLIRSEAFLRYVVQYGEQARLTTQWGPYGGFDVHGLAFLALGVERDRGRALLGGTLDMIDANLARERANPAAKWHLADFAIHPLLRAWFLYRHTDIPDDPIWERIAETVRGFLFHYGDLSENHNLLHLALRFLAGQTWPEACFHDGRPGQTHHDEARKGLFEWLDRWVREGTVEWGADIYYNVNFLALLNLYDFACDPTVKEHAGAVLDLFSLDEALVSFHGTMAGAARRSYSVYRMDLRESPSRPLHDLWYGMEDLPEPFNLNFVGGVLEAATSNYRPPSAVVWIARHGFPSESSTTHTVGLWPGQSNPGVHLSQHTCRLPAAMLGVMNSPGGEGGYSEHVWQLTLGESALVFSNHPSLENSHSHIQRDQGLLFLSQEDGLAHFQNSAPAIEEAPRRHDGSPWFWTPANMPPGHPLELRPGYWQGNAWRPRSFGVGRSGFLIYDIDPDDPLPWVHLFLPKKFFSEVLVKDQWIFVRHGRGYGAVWMSESCELIERGLWAGCEIRVNCPSCALFVLVGDDSTDGDFANFTAAAQACSPGWQDAKLSAREPATGTNVEMTWESGAYADGKTLETCGPRFATPWGAMPLGETAMTLETPGGECRLGF